MSHWSKEFKTRWQKLTLVERLANIGSEVNRALYWQKKKDFKNAFLAAERALDLLDFTAAVVRPSYRLGEILRVREVISDYFWNYGQYHTTPQILKKYFLPFAFYIRRDK